MVQVLNQQPSDQILLENCTASLITGNSSIVARVRLWNSEDSFEPSSQKDVEVGFDSGYIKAQIINRVFGSDI